MHARCLHETKSLQPALVRCSNRSTVSATAAGASPGPLPGFTPNYNDSHTLFAGRVDLLKSNRRAVQLSTPLSETKHYIPGEAIPSSDRQRDGSGAPLHGSSPCINQCEENPMQLVLHRLVLPPDVESQGPCCGHTAIMVNIHQSSCSSSSNSPGLCQLSQTQLSILRTHTCGRAPRPGCARCSKHHGANMFEVWARPNQRRQQQQQQQQTRQRQHQHPSLLHACDTMTQLASFLGVPEVRFVSHWGRRYGTPITHTLVRPGALKQQQAASPQELVQRDGTVPVMPPWHRSKLRNQIKTSNTAAKGLQVHLAGTSSQVLPLWPQVVVRDSPDIK